MTPTTFSFPSKDTASLAPPSLFTTFVFVQPHFSAQGRKSRGSFYYANRHTAMEAGPWLEFTLVLIFPGTLDGLLSAAISPRQQSCTWMSCGCQETYEYLNEPGQTPLPGKQQGPTPGRSLFPCPLNREQDASGSPTLVFIILELFSKGCNLM
jgi:hypothetical protein